MEKHQKGKGIQPGSLVMLSAGINPDNGKIFTVIRAEDSSQNTKVHPTERSSKSWVLDRKILAASPGGWSLVDTEEYPVPSKYLIPLNDPDAEPEDIIEELPSSKQKETVN